MKRSTKVTYNESSNSQGLGPLYNAFRGINMSVHDPSLMEPPTIPPHVVVVDFPG
jgi:hypothetical protein